MPYMPDDEKERLKKEISIQRLAEARGIKLRRSRALQQIHAATHPAEAHTLPAVALPSKAEQERLLAALESEEDDEEASS